MTIMIDAVRHWTYRFSAYGIRVYGLG